MNATSNAKKNIINAQKPEGPDYSSVCHHEINTQKWSQILCFFKKPSQKLKISCLVLVCQIKSVIPTDLRLCIVYLPLALQNYLRYRPTYKSRISFKVFSDDS